MLPPFLATSTAVTLSAREPRPAVRALACYGEPFAGGWSALLETLTLQRLGPLPGTRSMTTVKGRRAMITEAWFHPS